MIFKLYILSNHIKYLKDYSICYMLLFFIQLQCYIILNKLVKIKLKII